MTNASALKILLIEDSAGDAILIERAIKAGDPLCSVSVETTLVTALKRLSEEVFDIALLDRSLPDAEGCDGLLNIQTLAPRLPVVFLTAYRDEQTALEAISNGAQDYIFKDKLDSELIRRALHYAIRRKKFEQVLTIRANYDLLTGLANRALFESRLDMALARQKRMGANIGVLFLDLDRFKQVNDTYGHLIGDKLLKAVSQRIQRIFRPYDTFARFGGDEFAVLLEGLPKPGYCKVVADKVLNSFATPIMVDGIEIDIGVSIGITECLHNTNLDRETLMRNADLAMYEAKSVTTNSSYVFQNTTADVA